MTSAADHEHDDDVAPEVQEHSDVETEEYAGMLEDLDDEPTDSDTDTEDEDDDHADSI